MNEDDLEVKAFRAAVLEGVRRGPSTPLWRSSGKSMRSGRQKIHGECCFAQHLGHGPV